MQRPDFRSKNNSNNPPAKNQDKIKFTRLITDLPENEVFFGTITHCEILPKSDRLSMRIKLENSKTVFATSFGLPLPEYSPLNNLLAEITDDDEDEIHPKKLVNYDVKFSTRYVKKENGAEYCNLKTISFIYEDEDDEEEEKEQEQEKKIMVKRKAVPEPDDDDDEVASFFRDEEVEEDDEEED